MKFMLFVLPTVPASFEERRNLRPIGRNNERYQQMLDELRKLVVLAEQAGFDFAGISDHYHPWIGSTARAEENVAKTVVYGADPERHRAAIRKFADAGFDHVYAHPIGPDQEGLFRFSAREVLPCFRLRGLR
jgi:alkanesulfonate monooxygenase SsuD/methylene tetrahydromethanopterin reductase-like flavin-dependent oxidoreductase (luciferase family)